MADPGIYLRRALSYDHRGDTKTCVRLLHSLYERYGKYRADGALDRLRSSARCSYGYAIARLAALGHTVCAEAADLLRAGDGTEAN